MTLLNPVWLLMLIPLAVLWRLIPLSSRLLRTIRALLLIVLILALCGPAIVLPDRDGAVVVIADRSASMPDDALQRQTDAISLIQDARPSNSRLSVITFAQDAAIELNPQEDQFEGFSRQVDPDASRLDLALEQALGLIPPDHPGRIIMLSDGQFTGPSPLTAATRAASREIAIDYRLLQRPGGNDIAIDSIDAPTQVNPGESFFIHAWISTPVETTIDYRLTSDSGPLSSGTTALNPGLNRLTFRDQSAESGARLYTLTVQSDLADPLPQNNRARLLIGVTGPRPLLHLSGDEQSQFAALLQSSGVKVQTAKMRSIDWSLASLADYSGIILENLPAGQIGQNGMDMLAQWVTQAGAGLMITGGRRAYGPGGYFKSPLDPILPVSMELRQEHRKLSLAIVVALDRSGSMAAPAGGGKTKMDLANLASVQVLDLLGEMDELGVVAIDSAVHVIADCRPIGSSQNLRRKILSIDSQGGGIFCYTALHQAAEMIDQATAGTRHIILFADAADAEEPGEYVALLDALQQSEVTVSVVGLGTPSDSDADFLSDIARRGGGRIYFTQDAAELPRLFAQDTFNVARSTFIEDLTRFELTAGMSSLSRLPFDAPPALGGYNLCYLREGAIMAGTTQDEYEAPVVAAWQAGTGRTLAYTGQADGTHTGLLAQWSQLGEFYSSMARWIIGKKLELGENTLLTQDIENGVVKVRLHLDPERLEDPFAELPQINTLRGAIGVVPQPQRISLQWEDADTLKAEIPLHGNETILNTLTTASDGQLTLAPLCLPYSPEFRPGQAEAGRQLLKQLAATSGGQERLDLIPIWQDLPERPRQIALTSWVILIALLIFLTEILERRSGFLSQLRPTHHSVHTDQDATPHKGDPTGKRRLRKSFADSNKKMDLPAAEPDDPGQVSVPKTGEDVLDALSRAADKARKRR